MSYRGTDFGKRIDHGTVKKLTDYLFGKKEDSKYLDMATDINSKEFLKALTYYGILSEGYDCEMARRVKDMLERLAISSSRMGRLEAVSIMKQELPKNEIMFRGISEGLKKASGENE